MLGRLAVTCSRHRRLVFALWALVVALGAVAAPMVFGRLSGQTGVIESSESRRAQQLLWEESPQGPEVYAVADGREATDPALRASVTAVVARIEAVPGVEQVLNPYAAGGPAPEAVSTDGRAVAVGVRFEAGDSGWEAVDPAVEALRTIDAPRVLVGGGDLLDDEMDSQAAADLKRAELLSTPVVLLLLVLVFGGFVAAGLPLLIAFVGVATTFLALLAVSAVVDVSVYSVNILTMLGLGLAVDYSLLLVSRFREQRAVTSDVEEALRTTFGSAGRTVLFSGATVAASLTGLLVFPDDFLRSMGFASLAVVLLDMVVALTLLPAAIGAAAGRIRPARLRPEGQGAFVRIARRVRRRPVVLLVGGSLLLGLAAVPFAGARYADPDARSLPASSPSRQLAEVAEDRFAATADGASLVVVARDGGARGDWARYAEQVRGLDDVLGVATRETSGGRMVLDVSVEGREQGPGAQQLVRDLRALDAPQPVLVGGDAARLVDYQQALGERLPLAVAVVVIATLLLLFLFTGSVLLPVKAVLLSLLSLGASFGALVWVFQDGNLGGLVGTEALGSLSLTTPVLLVAIAFGLSMDYEVFLLGRIREEWERTGDAGLAVERGLQRTGSVVTAAAALMVVVFAGFVAGGFSPVKQVGLGLVLAVAVDATVVRMVLLPAAMTVLGRWAWWAPPALARLHGRIGLREEVTTEEIEVVLGLDDHAEAGTVSRS